MWLLLIWMHLNVKVDIFFHVQANKALLSTFFNTYILNIWSLKNSFEYVNFEILWIIITHNKQIIISYNYNFQKTLS
jgi:hypothetical protein